MARPVNFVRNLLIPLALCATLGGQSPPRPNLATYQKFFQQIADVVQHSDEASLTARGPGGKIVMLQPPALERVLGISQDEVSVLGNAAVKCTDALRLLWAGRSWVFEARLQRMASGSLSPAAEQQMKDYENGRNQIIIQAMEEFKSAAGDAAWTKVDQFVKSDKNPRLIMYTIRQP